MVKWNKYFHYSGQGKRFDQINTYQRDCQCLLGLYPCEIDDIDYFVC